MWPSMALLGLSWPFLAFLGLSWPFLAFLGLSWPFVAFRGLSLPCVTTCDLMRPSMIVCGLLWSFVATNLWSCPNSSVTILNRVQAHFFFNLNRDRGRLKKYWALIVLLWLYIAFSRGHKSKFICSCYKRNVFLKIKERLFLWIP